MKKTILCIALALASPTVHADDGIRLFSLPREKPLRFVDGPPDGAVAGKASFSGVARPGEFYVFQLGLVPSEPTGPLSLEFSPLSGPAGSIPASALRCISLGGVDGFGKKFVKDIRVPAGRVQVLWCGVDLPLDAAGDFQGTATLKSGDKTIGEFAITLNVSGEAVHDHGDSQAANLSRLRWLDSQVGSEPTLTKPFIPLRAEGRSLRMLGRELTLGENGLPEAITSYFNDANTALVEKGRPVLSKPFSLVVETQSGPVAFAYRFGKMEVSDLSANWSSEGKADDLEIATRGTMDYTGSGEIKVRLKALKDVDLRDVRLEIPVQEAAAKYFMGLHKPGGRRPADGVKWAWDVVSKRQDCFWMGDVNAGMMVRFKDESFRRPLVNIYYHNLPLVLPKSWGNGGKGGITVGKAENGMVPVAAFCGPRQMKAGETLDFNFELYLTPFRTLDTEQQWAVRFVHPGPAGNDPSRIENALKTMDAKAGPNVLNIHQAQHAAPFINYPYADENFAELKDIVRRSHEKGTRTRIYYTTRELTQNLKELHALHSMNGEIIFPGAGKDSRSVIHKNGPHPWLTENLGANFTPAWVDHIQRAGVEWDLSVLTTPDSRWNNFYLQGLQWMVDQADIDGIYIDDSALDARSLQRARRILDARPGRLIDLHTFNQNNDWCGFANNLCVYMELLPYLDRLWIGEAFSAKDAAFDFWLVEMSGIPFGLMSEMLDHANPWKGLVFGETARFAWSGDPRSIWKAWDTYGIQGTEFLPAFAQKIVSTGNSDVHATVYRKKGRSFLAIANWGAQAAEVTPQIDWQALGLDPAKASLYAPPIEGVQQEALWKPGDPMEILPNKGYFLVIDEEPRKVDQVKNGTVAGAELSQLFLENFTAPTIPDGWKTFQSNKAKAEALSVANSLVIKQAANLHAGLEFGLPKGVMAAEAEVQVGTDAGLTWGPGIALVWPDGKTAKMNIRTVDKKFGLFGGDGFRMVGAPLDLKQPISMRILLGDDRIFFLQKENGKWVTIESQSRAGRAGDPASLRIGKLAEDGSLADFSGETGPNGECQFKAVSAYGK